MQRFENATLSTPDDLPHILNELSFSYSMLYSVDESLEELEKTVKELKDLVNCLMEAAAKQ
jgi:archaellum component FlaC